MGGFDGNTFLNTVESYEPRMNKWKLVSKLRYIIRQIILLQVTELVFRTIL